MRRIGLDVGSKTIGVALGDPLGLTASPLEVVERQGWKKEAARLEELVSRYGVEEIVVGLPLRTDGSAGVEAEGVRRFGERLAARLRVPVVFWDERFSTALAESSLLAADVSRQKRRQVIDAVAAAIILQNFLDYKAKESSK